jgi:minor fimbrial subunit
MMNKTCLLLLGAASLWMTASVRATVCYNSNGSPTDIAYDLSNTFNSSNNQVGQVITLPEKSGWVGVQATCPAGTTVNYTYRSYVTTLPVQNTEGSYQYLKLNDYLQGAMQITDSAAGVFYPPRNYIRMGVHTDVSLQRPFDVLDSRLVFRLKVTRPFINMVPIPRQTMLTVYVTSTASDALNTPVYTISYSGRVEVPQNCKINAGETVEFDFDNIGAALFSKAGAGGRPSTATPQNKRIAIKCTNIDAQAYLSMRLEAEKYEGDMMVSDNPDVGFKIAEEGGNVLTPNTLASKIPFQLDDNAEANLGIRAWPVSVTGKKPAEGPFTARGYLRVDFD